MQHVDRLIAMRRKGWVPTRVHIDLDFPTKVDHLIPFDPEHPQAYIGPDENLQRLDLRVLVGLEVNVSGLDAARVEAVVEACRAAGAKRVLGITHTTKGTAEEPSFPVAAITDTQGEAAWQKS